MSIFAGFKCNACGSTEFKFAHNPPEDTDIMTCAECGREFGTVSEIKTMAHKHMNANGPAIDASLKAMTDQKRDS